MKKKPFSLEMKSFFCALCVFVLLFAETSHAEPKIWAGARDYSPETVVSIFGMSFGANMTLTIKITRPNGTVVLGDGSFLPGSDTVKTDSAGEFVYLYTLDGIKGDYTAEAVYSVGGADIVLATHVFKDDGGHIDTTSAFGVWGGKGTSIGTKHHFKKGEAVWLMGGSLPANTDFSWNISHKNHVEATGFLSTGPTGVIAPDPTMLWDIPMDFITHVDPSEGDHDKKEEKGKYKVRVFKPGKSKSIADENFTINPSGDPLPDYGDAPDPSYSSLHDSVGAWHLDFSREWLGAGVDGEMDSNQVDVDIFDDGVTFSSVFAPGTPSDVSVLVNTSGLGASRYDNNDPTTLLYVNAWADWNGDGDWDDLGEKIIGSGSSVGQAKIDPSTFPGNSKTFIWSVTPPSVIANIFYTRFRLDRGQDGGSLFVGDGMEQPRGKAFHGEVEDYEIDRFVTPVSFSGALVPDGAVNASYSYPLSIAGGNPPYTWSLLTGALPGGLTLNTSTGEISGTPTTVGNSDFTVQVTDSTIPTSGSSTQANTLTVGPPATSVNIVEASLPSGVEGATYSSFLTTQTGTGPNTWSLFSGALPDGVTLNSATGEISGMPLTPGNFNFVVQVTDSATPTTTSDTQALGIEVAPALSITWGVNQSSARGIFVHVIPTVTGGSPGYTWSNPGGGLPTGFTLDPSTGAIFGTPANVGSFIFTLQVTDQNLVQVSKVVTWDIIGSVVSLEYLVEPGYGMGDSVEPNAGLASNVFLFKVIYKNSSNLPPDSIGVFIDTGFFATELETPCAIACDFITGVAYRYFAILPPGIHSYYFFASDGSGDARLPGIGELNNLVVTSAGADPVLSFSTEPVFNGTGGISPLTGDDTTLFQYKVIFEDPDNLPPQTIQVFIDGSSVGTDMTLDVTAAVALNDGDYANAEQYVFETSLNAGNHFYVFSAVDADSRRVDLSTVSVLAGPVVSGVPAETVTGNQVTPGENITLNFTGFDATGCGATPPQIAITKRNSGTAPPVGFLAGTNAYFDLTISPCAVWTSVTVSLNYQDSEIVTSENTLKVFHNPLADGKWVDVTTGTSDAVHNIVRFQATSFSEFLLAGDVTTLISLNYFDAKVQGNDVLLTWETASEIDNVGFNIWRSSDEEAGYSKINETMIPGRGSSLSGERYRFIDKNTAGEVNFYRLEDIDSSGKGTLYSEAIMVQKANGTIAGLGIGANVQSDADESKKDGGGCFIGTLDQKSDKSVRGILENWYVIFPLGLLLFLIIINKGMLAAIKE